MMVAADSAESRASSEGRAMFSTVAISNARYRDLNIEEVEQAAAVAEGSPHESGTPKWPAHCGFSTVFALFEFRAIDHASTRMYLRDFWCKLQPER